METKKKKRAWVKDAAIAFLAVMLVLTFFSNTIMNISLPEVSTKVVGRGTITQKIRGTGKVEANEVYEVRLNEIRVIKKVAVREGQTVTNGSVLFTFEGEESSELKYAKETLKSLQRAYENAQLNVTDFDYSRQEWEISKADDELNKALAALDGLKEGTAEYVTAKAKAESLEVHRADLEFELSETMKADLKTYDRQQLELKNYEEDISDQKAYIAKLESESAGTEIISPVSGLVKKILAYSGQQTEYGGLLALIEVTESGYSLSFSVTNEQSELAAVGRKGEIYNYYYGGNEGLKAILDHIETDPDNPSTNKLLTFEIQGNIESGAQLSVSISATGTEYPSVVPNSVVRVDSNGYYVLTLNSKNTPLGIRYYAERTGITVLEKDDNYTAVSGAFSGGEYIILTSSKPIEGGDQVRLPD